MESQLATAIPLPIKLIYTLFLCLLVPIYWRGYGLTNFLWFCDIDLLVLLPALWLESRLLNSMMAVGMLLFLLGWNLDFLTGGHVFGMVDYMFDSSIPFYIRQLSLYHLVLPFLHLFLLRRLGYDRRALLAQSLLMWVVLLVCYIATDPATNINWAFGLEDPQTQLHPFLYLVFLMGSIFMLVYLPTHLMLRALFESSPVSYSALRRSGSQDK